MSRALRFLLLSLLLAGCSDNIIDAVVPEEDGGNDTDTDVDTDADTDTDSGTDTDTDTDTVGEDRIRMEIQVPAYFGEDSVKLVVQFDSAASPEGPPEAEGETIPDPPITPGIPGWIFHTSQGGLDGQYYVGVVLYVVGGGTDIPAPGIDWVGKTMFPVGLGPGTGTVDIGVIPLQPAPP